MQSSGLSRTAKKLVINPIPEIAKIGNTFVRKEI